MRTRWLVVALTVSLVLNALLLVAWFRALRPAPVAARSLPRRLVVTNLLRPIRTNLVFQPRLLTWRDIESEDYLGYVRNLRAIGCPEATVRDIILADVDELFAARRLAELPNPRREWWRSDPDPERLREHAERRAALEADREALLKTLLGEGWSSAPLTARLDEEGNPLDGGPFDTLSAEARLRVRQIERRNTERRTALLAEGALRGGSPAQEDLEQLQQDTRTELATVLDPAQLEEYLLRYSQAADRLRSELRGLEPTAEEFKRLFLARESLAASRNAGGTAGGAEALATSGAAAEEEDAILAEVLGPERYTHFRLNRDPAFQQLRHLAEQAGLDAAQLLPLYQVNQAVDTERERLLKDPELDPEARTRQLTELELQRRAGLRLLLGEDQLRRLEAAGLP
jgi:hypothetical protein